MCYSAVNISIIKYITNTTKVYFNTLEKEVAHLFDGKGGAFIVFHRGTLTSPCWQIFCFVL